MTEATDTDETGAQQPEITDDVIEQLAAVRDSGKTNMWDKEGVTHIADEAGHGELVEFAAAAGPDQYTEALMEMGRHRRDQNEEDA
jgi:hypothetical protein